MDSSGIYGLLKITKDRNPEGLNPVNAVTILERDVRWSVDLKSVDPAIP